MLYEFTRLKLDRDEFENLVFMGYPHWWKEDKARHTFLIDLCYKPLKKVAVKVIEKSGLDGQDIIPVKVFDSIDIIAKDENSQLEKDPWFRHHACLSLSFSKGRMDKLWIRNLVNPCVDPRERGNSPDRTFYIKDGNHRALVYAVHLELGKAIYESVDAIHATSWDIASGILGHDVQKADNLEHNGKLQCDKNLSKAFDNLPNNIQINTYKR